MKNKDLAAALADDIGSAGGRAAAIQADIAALTDVRRMFEEAESALGPLDIVVASAAVAVTKPFLDCTEADYDQIFDANAKGTFFLLQEAARRVRDGGRIIAVSTGGTQMRLGNISLYLGSKGAVEQFVRVLSRELGPRGITVNALLPGFTDTDMLPDHDRAVAAGQSPFNRVGAPADVADVAVFLASAAARWVTGHNIPAGGGVF